MSEVSHELVKHVAHLARVYLNNEEVSQYQDHLSKMVKFFDELDSIESENVKPLYNVMTEYYDHFDKNKKLRSDDIKESLGKDETLKNAPDKALDQFKVNAVLSESEG